MQATNTSQYTNSYIGRFAPSPTGPLHIGSMLAALGSYLQARHQQGKWLVRIEDLDPPREVPGASDDILRTLERYHLYWDDDIVYQHKRHERYREILDTLQQNQLLYPCTCSRKLIQETALVGPLGMIYPGTCRVKKTSLSHQYSLRLILPDTKSVFKDAIQPEINLNLRREIGDVVLKRADGFFAYHLAVVVDDNDQQITEVVRGSDLLYSTPVHLILQYYLEFKTPTYVHLPILLNQKGEKLSKQTGAKKVDIKNIESTLIFLLQCLGQKPPADLHDASVDEILHWATSHWQLQAIPAEAIIVGPET